MSNINELSKLDKIKIKIEDYCKNVDFMTLSSDQQTNCLKLIQAINGLLDQFGENRIITSGYRRMEDHLRIYKDINKKRKDQGLQEIKVPMGSKHLIAAAIDLEDSNGKLDQFCTDDILKKYGLYREHPDHTIGWCHLQIIPPKSGKLTFIP